MLIKLRFIIFAIFLFACMNCGSSSIASKKAHEQLSSDDWKLREKGVITLIDIKARERNDHKLDKATGKKLLDLVEKEASEYKNYENKLRVEGKSAEQAFDELFKKYPPTYGDYIKALALLTASENVENSLQAIFKLIVDTGYNISPTILTLYGSKYLDFFIEKATKGDAREREIAVSALAIWLNPSEESDELDISSISPLSENEFKRAENTFLNAISDSDYNVRYTVLSSLGGLIYKPEVEKMVKAAAESDSEQFIRRKAADILKEHKARIKTHQ